jgi:hypothetical protein
MIYISENLRPSSAQLVIGVQSHLCVAALHVLRPGQFAHEISKHPGPVTSVPQSYPAPAQV